MLKEGQEIKFNKIVYNLVKYLVKGDTIIMSVKKHLTCRICEEIDLAADIVGNEVNWETLRKVQ